MRRKRAALVLVAVLAPAAVVAVLGVDWRLVRTHWHTWRVDRARTYQEAVPWLESLEEDARYPPSSARIVAELGAERQYFTFWVFWRFVELSKEEGGPQREEIIPIRLGRMLPILKEMCRRAEEDEEFLAAWAHFIHWGGPARWQVLGEVSKPARNPSLVSGLTDLLGAILLSGFKLDFSDEIAAFAEKHPEAFEAVLRLIHLCLLGEARILGMSPLPEQPDYRLPRSKEEAISREKEGLDARAQILAWLRQHPEEARDKRDWIVTPPILPLPGWTGPPPAVKAGK